MSTRPCGCDPESDHVCSSHCRVCGAWIGDCKHTQPPAPAERERSARLDALAYETALAVVRADIEFRYEGPLESQVAIIRAALDAAAHGGE